MIYWLSYVLLMVVLELVYFKLADRYHIIDKPNQRSSHTTPIIRGGGIIFIFGLWFWFLNASLQWPYVVMGATLVAMISFADDLKPRSTLLRFLVHLTATALLFYEVHLYEWNMLLVLLAVIVCIGTLSAFNFMDGINGITGIYAIVNLGSFLYLDKYVIDFTDSTLLLCLIVANAIFLFLNFRSRASCFAGDVGSITLAFVQIFFLLQLIVMTDSLLWPLIFLVFGIDSVMTIIYRIKRRENIFKAHRSHLYQYLANEMGWDHRVVSLMYGAIQLGINVVLVTYLVRGSIVIPLIVTGVVLVLYLVSRTAVIAKIKQTT